MKKKITAIVLAGMMVMALAGCSHDNGSSDKPSDNGSSVENVTVNNEEDVLTFAETVRSALSAQQSGKTDSALALEGNLYMPDDRGTSMTLSYDGTISTEALFAEGKTKTSVDGTLKFMGAVDVKAAMEAYTASDNGNGHELYAKVSGVDVDDSWKKFQENGSGIPVLMDADFYQSVKDNHVEATLESASEKVGDTDCKVLSVKLTGEYAANAAGNLIEYIFGIQVSDWSTVSVGAKIYVDAAANLPVQMTVDAKDMVSQIMELCKDQNKLVVGASNCTVTCTAGSWGQISSIDMDNEAHDAKTSEDGIRWFRTELFN